MTTANGLQDIQWAGLDHIEAPRDKLKMQIEIYTESILIRKMDQQAVKVMMVSADDIADILAQHTKYESGILPADTLWWKKSHTVLIAALWKPPQVWAIALQTEPFKPPTRFNLPMPGLIFLCSPKPPTLGLRGEAEAGRAKRDHLQDPNLQHIRRRASLPRQPRLPQRG